MLVTDPSQRALIIYATPTGAHQAPLARIIETAPDKPIDVSSNFIGEVYVANENGNVRVYGAGPDRKYQLVRSYEGPHTRMQHLTAISVNKAGSFYVADIGGGHPRVEWFSGGANQDILPDKVLEGPHTGIQSPSGVAIDGSGRLFVADHDAKKILIFDPNAENDAAPEATITTPHAPGRIAVDDLMNVYVANPDDASITVFNSNGPQTWDAGKDLKSQDLRGLGGIAIDATGEIATAVADGITFFPHDASGETEPSLVLRGAPLSHPSGVGIHPLPGSKS